MSESIIRITNLKKVFASAAESIVLFDGLDFEFSAQRFYSLTGASGSGKSTLLHLVAGIDRPTAGRIEVAGTTVSHLNERQMIGFRQSTIGLVFQFHYLLKDFSAEENVMLPAYMAGLPRVQALARARELLVEVGLTGRFGHYPGQLSGGERQRAAVARALINSPKVVLADEPTGNLDETHSRQVEDMLIDVVRNHGATLLLVTHDTRLAQRSDEHYRLWGGTLEAVE